MDTSKIMSPTCFFRIWIYFCPITPYLLCNVFNFTSNVWNPAINEMMASFQHTASSAIINHLQYEIHITLAEVITRRRRYYLLGTSLHICMFPVTPFSWRLPVCNRLKSIRSRQLISNFTSQYPIMELQEIKHTEQHQWRIIDIPLAKRMEYLIMQLLLLYWISDNHCSAIRHYESKNRFNFCIN